MYFSKARVSEIPKLTTFRGSLALISLAFFIFNSCIVLSDVNETVTIDVNVTQTAAITVWPDTLNWTSVGTGTVGGVQYVNIKNTGSVNVSQVYAYVDTLVSEPVRPYGLAYAKNYSAGGVITLMNETDSKYYFAGRLEWNWTQDIPNNDWSAVTTPASWGFMRNTTNDYVWVLGSGTDDRCNESDAQFSIETDIDIGTTATRTPDNTFTISTSAGNPEEWGYTSITTGPLAGHCVAAYYDCSKIYIYNFDKRSSFSGCSNAEYLQADNLVSGYSMILSLDAWVPNGYPSGFLNQTILTVYATA